VTIGQETSEIRRREKRSKHEQHFTMAVCQPDDGRPQ